MPTSSSAATVDKKKSFKLLTQKSTEQNGTEPQTHTEKHLLKIAPALPFNNRRILYVRSHSTLNATSISKAQDGSAYDCPALQTGPEGVIQVSRTQNEKEKHPDRISLDRRGLTHVPVIEAEPRLRLLSLQHNLISDLETLSKQKFPTLVFLDVYDNQLEQIKSLDVLENLRVLLMGKNRIKKIEGLENLKKLEVLDLHGNQIGQVSGLAGLLELKVLNLAGNQIRIIGVKDLQGLEALQELNLRRNRLRKLLGCGDMNNLGKLFLSNNDLQSVDDISSIAKSQNIKEISIDNNPVFLAGDCVSFLVSYLPHLVKLNAMQITEQVRKAAMAWRRNKGTTNAAFMDLTSETTLNCRREEVISNARTNWELLRSQTKCLTNNGNTVDKTLKNLKPDSDFILTSLTKPNMKTTPKPLQKSKTFTKMSSKVPILPDKKLGLVRIPSQDTETSQNTSNTSSSNTSNEFLKLPPILVPIISKLEKTDVNKDEGPNIDSSSSMASGSERAQSTSSSSPSSSETSESESEQEGAVKEQCLEHREGDQNLPLVLPEKNPNSPVDQQNASNSTPEDTSSNLSTNTVNSGSVLSAASTSESEKGSLKSSSGSLSRNIKSAVSGRSLPSKSNNRASTAKPKKPQGSPIQPKDREQGGDYLIEICGRHLNIYGQGALRFIDKPWNASKANDVTTVKFNYVNFNSLSGSLSKIKHRFPNGDNFVFKETNITCLGQLNAISEVQGKPVRTTQKNPEAILKSMESPSRSNNPYFNITKKLKLSARKLQRDITVGHTPAKSTTNLFPSTSTAVTPTPSSTTKRKILGTPNTENIKRLRANTPKSVPKPCTTPSSVVPRIKVTHATLSLPRQKRRSRTSMERQKRLDNIRRKSKKSQNFDRYAPQERDTTRNTTYTDFQTELSSKEQWRSTILPEIILTTPAAPSSRRKMPKKETPFRTPLNYPAITPTQPTPSSAYKTPSSRTPAKGNKDLTQLRTCRSNLNLLF